MKRWVGLTVVKVLPCALKNKWGSFAFPPQLQCPIGVTMFDFQTMCYTSPMMDLVTFMANSTGVDVRGRHFEEIFRAYHTELINVLADKQQQQTTRDDLQARYSWVNRLLHYLQRPRAPLASITSISILCPLPFQLQQLLAGVSATAPLRLLRGIHIHPDAARPTGSWLLHGHHRDGGGLPGDVVEGRRDGGQGTGGPSQRHLSTGEEDKCGYQRK